MDKMDGISRMEATERERERVANKRRKENVSFKAI